MISGLLALTLMVGQPVIVGDSIAYSARHQLRARGFIVDAVPGRRMDQIRSAPGARVVVYELSTNGRLRLGTCTRLVDRTAGSVWLVTNTRHPRNNRVLRACARRTGARIIHWAGYTHRHPGLLRPDGVHLTPRGRRAFAGLVSRKIQEGSHHG